MSYSLFTPILNASPLTTSEKIVMIVLADHAREDGTCIYPSVRTICRKTNLSDRCVRNCLSSLVKKAVLRIVKSTLYSPNIYEIVVESLENMSYQEENLDNNGWHQMPGGGSTRCQGGVAPDARGVAPDARGVAPDADKTLINPYLNNKYISQENDFSEKTEPIQKPETPFLEEKTIQPEKPVEAKKTSQPALPFSEKETEKKPPKAKSGKIPKTRIDPNMELTPERIQVALDHGLHSSWVESEFNAFKKHYVENGKIRPGWDASWNSWAERAATIYNPNGMKSKPHPVKSSISLETSATTLSPPAQLAVADKNLGSFVKTFPHIDGTSIFAEAQMLKFGDKITIYHEYAFCLNQMKIEEDRLMKFFNVSTVEFTTEPLQEPSIKLVWPPKPETEKASMPENKPEPYTPPATEIKPPRYRTLNESYQGSTSQSLGASLAALQRSYQQKFKNKTG